jgi:hypothetical protein
MTDLPLAHHGAATHNLEGRPESPTAAGNPLVALDGCQHPDGRAKP